MYDNGVLSFLQPGTQGALPNWQWNAQPIGQANGKYFIAPLWADIAPTSQTRYIVDQTATTAKFTWSNIAEYYSAWGNAPRLNTFSAQIDSTGGIAVKYNTVNLQTSAIGIGVRGDADYTQMWYSSCCMQKTAFSDWSLNTAPPPPPPPAPVPVAKPVTVPETVTQVVQQTTQPTVVQETQTPTTTTLVVAPVASVAAPTSTAAAPTATSTSSVTGVAALSEPVKTETKKTATKSSSSSDNAESSVLSLALSVASNSSNQSQSQQQQSVVITTQDALTLVNKPTVTASTPMAGSSTAAAMLQMDGQSQSNGQLSSGNSVDSKDTTGLIMYGILTNPEYKNEQKERPMNKSAVTTTDLGPTNPGFVMYLTTVIPDVAFYKPKDIYKNQRTVDNTRLLRSLTNEGKYENLINLQYQR